MLTESQVRQFAGDWLRAWNSHDLDAIMSHYAPEIVLTIAGCGEALERSVRSCQGATGIARLFQAWT